jgi:hypothetical protein
VIGFRARRPISSQAFQLRLDTRDGQPNATTARKPQQDIALWGVRACTLERDGKQRQRLRFRRHTLDPGNSYGRAVL